MSAIDSIEIAACALQTSATKRNHEKSRCRTDPDRRHLHGPTSTPAQADEPIFPSIRPGKLDEARQAHERLCQMAQKADDKPPKPFGKASWLRTAVRSKPAVHPSKGRPAMQGADHRSRLAFRFRRLKRSLHKLQKSHGSYMPAMNANQ